MHFRMQFRKLNACEYRHSYLVPAAQVMMTLSDGAEYEGSGCSASSTYGSPWPVGPGPQATPSSTICQHTAAPPVFKMQDESVCSLLPSRPQPPHQRWLECNAGAHACGT